MKLKRAELDKSPYLYSCQAIAHPALHAAGVHFVIKFTEDTIRFGAETARIYTAHFRIKETF